MIRKLALAALIALPTSTVAHGRETVRKIGTTTAAPSQFDVPYTGNLTIWRVRSEQALRAITIPTSEPNWGGVAYAVHNRKQAGTPATVCNIYILEEGAMKGRGWNFNLVLRHELAHCNGWKGHEGGKKVLIGTSMTAPTLPESTRWLPAYPPLHCITPDRTLENCADRHSQKLVNVD
jgi:hypothetical protein